MKYIQKTFTKIDHLSDVSKAVMMAVTPMVATVMWLFILLSV